ncbi:hypothetical protein AURDEDRAFT_162303 [Auricularia subglabra TFB-10046 SS5]|nr:hypothetical protein AURDEDRAFT_162303 [Auricularia subglabra TFB-10046 SS5]
MVRTRSRSYASDEDVKPPGSLPGGPTPIHNRVRELRDTIARLATPRMPASRVFAMLGADSPGRRESWEGLTTPVKPTGVVYEGQGSLQRADELPPASETVQHTFAATPRISPAAPAGTPSTLGVVESVKNFEFPLKADKTTESVADASFRTADPESAPATPAKPVSPPPTPPPGPNEPKPAAQEVGKPGKRAEKRAEKGADVTPAAAEPVAAPPSKPKSVPVPRRNRSPVSGPFPEPTVKFRAPASGDASSGTWKTVSEGAVIDTEGWVTSVKRGAPSKTASEVVAVPVITGPQQFPDWYLHYNSGDNSFLVSGRDEGRGK